MATANEDSYASLPARPVHLRNNRSSSGLRTGIGMPTYTIQEDPPWLTRASHAPSVSSVYSNDYIEPLPNDNTHDVAPLNARASYHPSFHAQPNQQIADKGPQVRQSRLPIFNQVRSMLHKPPPILTPGNVKWDELSGEMCETGKPARVNPSTYVSPYEGAFKAARKRSPERANKLRKSSAQVSVLRDEYAAEVKPPAPLKVGCTISPVLPVSPISPIPPLVDRAPSPISVNSRTAPLPAQTPTVKAIKRKPAPTPVTMSSFQEENHEPQRSPSQDSDWTEPPDDDLDDQHKQAPVSHFSWTTYAPSLAPGRPSMETRASRHTHQLSTSQQPDSRFSWSTMNTTTTHQLRPDSPPPSPPPTIPEKFFAPPAYDPQRGPPVQSILSRRRPVQRLEKEEWTPPPRNHSGGTPRSATPMSATTAIHPAFRSNSPATTTATSKSSSAKKALPLPPELASPATPLSHLESLLAQERDIVRQRKNVEKMLAELEKIDKASPMDVPFATVRENKKKLEQQRKVLAEVLLDERDLGIAISRTRRKEGEEEGLWVRRVTG